MKNHKLSKLRLAIASLAAIPAIALAVPPTTSPYYTDQANSYVQDQTSQTMGQLNNILCFMGAMAPDLMVNLTTNSGNYIALVNENTCGSGGGGGGQSNNTGPKYTSVIVNSSRASSTAPMLVKAWVGMPQMDIAVYASATQAPSAAGATPYLPYGVFRMDYCGTATGGVACAVDKGFINATSTGGLSFYSGSSFGGFTDTTALQLSATSSSAGSGAITNTNNWTGSPVTSTFTFAYNTSYFVRNDGTTDKCFNRDPLVADESVWRYGLYNSTTGAQITRKSGFPIEYTDTGTGVTSNGYIGYYGLWMPVTVASGATVNQVSYDTNPPTKTAYTLLKTGGKLMKFTTANKTLADLNKVTFWYFAQNTIAVQGGGTLSSMTSGSQYELYWDNANTRFAVSGQQGTSGNMQPLAVPGFVNNADMITANPWGLFGWSQMLGGQFGIKGSDFAALTGGTPSTIPVVTQLQDVVYPDQYAAITGGLTCINDCPTVASIAASGYINSGWTQVASGSFVNYTLNATTGNLVDGTAADVVSTATTGVFANGVRSGRLITPADKTAMILAKDISGVCGGTTPGTCTAFNQGDVDFLPVGSSYYVWETGGQPWNQIALLMNGTTPVQFEAPLQVNFTVPSGAKYGNYAGATMSLQYGGFGDLWGIPNECVDITTNLACDFSGTPNYSNFRWTSLFSIPFDATAGIVTVPTTQGTVTAGTQYLVKALDKEIRLKNELTSVCSTAGLTAPVFSSITLPAEGGWLNPTVAGKTPTTKPTFTTVPAPQVIHGVKQY